MAKGEPLVESRRDGSDRTDRTQKQGGEFFINMIKEYDKTRSTQKIYAEASERLLGWIEKQWLRFCEITQLDPIEHLNLFLIGVLNSFFYWLLQERSDSLRTASTLQTYWNGFALYRRKETGCSVIDLETKREWQGVQQRLVKEFQLNTGKKPKPIVRVEDEFELLGTLWGSTEMDLEHERLRVQEALLIQLAGITGNRPDALLSLRYKHVKLFLLRDPNKGELPRPIFELTFGKTKSYMGDKDPNTIAIPEVAREPCLILCPHILLLTLIFLDDAFAAPALTGPEEFARLRVPPGLHQLAVPIKDSKSEVPLFRRLERTCYGTTVSPDNPATGQWFRDTLRRLSFVTGLEWPVGPYSFRRGAGEAFDSSSLISDAQRNQIMQHHDSSVYLKNYMPSYIGKDLQAIVRGLPPQEGLMRAASGISRSIDRRRPRALKPSQLAQVRQHPEVKLLRRRKENLRNNMRARGITLRAKNTEPYRSYLQLCRQLQSKEKKVKRAMMADVRATYRKEQPVADIENQLRGHSEQTMEQAESEASLGTLSTERQRAFNALFTIATSDPVEESERRSEAIDAVTALCRSSPSKRNVSRAKRAFTNTGSVEVRSKGAENKPKPLSFPIECMATQCIFCLGNVNITPEERTHAFGAPGDLKKHFHRKHLRHIPEGEAIGCPHPECGATLEDKPHLQNHAATVHGTLT